MSKTLLYLQNAGHVYSSDWFAFLSGFNAQPLYEDCFLVLFNQLYLGLFQTDMSKEQSLYELFNYWVLSKPPMAQPPPGQLLHDMTEPLSDYQSFAAVVALLGLLLSSWKSSSSSSTGKSCLCWPFSSASASTWSKLLTLHNPSQNPPVIFADWHALFHSFILLVVLIYVSLNTRLYWPGVSFTKLSRNQSKGRRGNHDGLTCGIPAMSSPTQKAPKPCNAGHKVSPDTCCWSHSATW